MDGDIWWRYRFHLTLDWPELVEYFLMNIALALFLKEPLERRVISCEKRSAPLGMVNLLVVPNF